MPLLVLILTVVNGWLVFVLRDMKSDLKDLRVDHTSLVAKQSAHELLMARSTIGRDEFRSDMSQQTIAIKEFIKQIASNGGGKINVRMLLVLLLSGCSMAPTLPMPAADQISAVPQGGAICSSASGIWGQVKFVYINAERGVIPNGGIDATPDCALSMRNVAVPRLPPLPAVPAIEPAKP